MQDSIFLTYLKMSYLPTFIRFLFISSLLYIFFYRTNFSKNKIFDRFNKPSKMKKEFIASTLNLLIFSLAGLAIHFVKERYGYSVIYSDINKFGYLWFALSILAAIIFTDTYFYWVHRLFHSVHVYKFTHKFHHQFSNPTPFASYSLDIIEGFVLAFSLFVILLVIPMHPMAILIYTSFSIFWNSFIHLGYEVLPKWWLDHPISKYVNTPTHHYTHHQYFTDNYSLYFTFWDKAMATEHLKTRETFFSAKL